MQRKIGSSIATKRKKVTEQKLLTLYYNYIEERFPTTLSDGTVLYLHCQERAMIVPVIHQPVSIDQSLPPLAIQSHTGCKCQHI